MPRNNSLRDLVFLKLPIWVVPTTCDDFVKRRLGNSFYINVGTVIRVDTHNIRSDDAVLGDWHWFKDIHLLLMVFFSQVALKLTGHFVTSDRRHRCACSKSHLLLLGLALLGTDVHLLRVRSEIDRHNVRDGILLLSGRWETRTWLTCAESGWRTDDSTH